MTGEDQISETRRRLEVLRSQHGPVHPDVIQLRTDLAELTGKQGDLREAARLYQQLGDDLRNHLGLDSRTLDAYEGMARWIGARGRA
ncbi:hypothetical protein PV726_31950 [Streptomyces europaeiscabiei]|uniref:hypothetical protein n=1 Tax=Streptomyces europaeiscabiei TaxID=146819 RepID=UPI0029AF8184|nr:hypothetical protein [Streptomyces europaeiscabiei]MDX3694869.1 hypothetical protein [Streptomyces europaeiscabiei]